MKRLGRYLNPVARLGQKKYSVLFPLIFMAFYTGTLEYFAQHIFAKPQDVGLFAIFLNIALMIYFSFRDGIRGGLIVVIFTLLYYFYIIFTRQNSPEQIASGIRTTLVLGLVYILLASIIGWLRQTLDTMIGREKEARMQAEDEKRRLQTIIEQLPVGVIITDDQGKVIKTNKRLESIIGMKIPIGHTEGKNILLPSTHNREISKPADSPIARTLSTGKTITGQEFSFTHKNGKTIHVQVSASVVKNKNKKTIAAVSLINDVTQQKELENRKDDFINMASHELKTPLTSAKLFIRTLKSKSENPQQPLINKVEKQVDKLLILVKELLDVTNINQGRLKLNMEKFILQDAVNEVINDLQPTTQHTLRVIAQTDKPVIADREKIIQVITNLITNAIKYSDAGTEIRISSGNSKGVATVNVQDFGIGIAENQQKDIFDRFYQAHNADNKNTYPGLGLGLFIASQIVKLHKGKLWVNSREGKGSTFSFSLPAAI